MLDPDIIAAYEFVDSMKRSADAHVGTAPLWHGWALRDAFAAGAKWGDANHVTSHEIVKPHSRSSVPHIGEYWQGMGGIYCGIARGEDGQPDHHLILAEAAPEQNFNWSDALEFAKTVVADGHQDFSVPTRFESALLYANVRDKLNQDNWHWTSTQFSELSAWTQYFSNGRQDYYYKSCERRCRVVRRSIL